MKGSSFNYLDNNATTRVAPEVVEAMAPFLTERWGNPSSAYCFGRELRKELERAREQVGGLIGAEPQEIVFTSGGTESINAALQSALHPEKRHVVMTAVEHPASIYFGSHLQRQGYEITHVPVDREGRLDLRQVEGSLRPDTALVSVMWANNETGVLFPVEEVGRLCRSRGVLFHTDAVQAAGKVAIDVGRAQVDFLSLSAHKLHGPKGVGVLYVNRGVKFQPYIMGGHQQQGRRGGTENVALVVGFGRAAALARLHLNEQSTRIRAMRDRLEGTLMRRIPGTERNGAKELRLPNTSNLSFGGVEAETLVLALDREGICVSSGSACTTGSLQPSHVLTAMGMAGDRARGAIRFSLGHYNTESEVDQVLEVLPGALARLRASAPGSPG